MRTATVAAAARRAGLSERTLWRYLSDAEFKQALRERQDKATSALGAALTGLSDKAIETLTELLEDTETPPSVQARVALSVVKQRGDLIELADLSERISRLEEKWLEGKR